MTLLTRLRIKDFRNLRVLDLLPSPGINLILGPNASGKSSLLETVHLLSCGKSFRTRHLAQTVSHETAGFVITGNLSREGIGDTTLGMEYGKPAGLRMKIDGKSVQRLSQMVSALPAITIHQDSQQIFTQGPEWRRAFLDWGLFHVEPLFLPNWQRYRRALRQRNSMLQGSARLSEVWDKELVETAQIMDNQRQRYLQRFIPLFQEFLSLLCMEEVVEIKYRPGWNPQVGLAAQLARSLNEDRRMGYTRLGAHRADLDFLIKETLVRETFSRGQLKVLVYALYLAQACTLAELTGKRGVILMDDLAAELDRSHIDRLMTKIAAMGFQSFVTSSDPQFADYVRAPDRAVFHVEQGKFAKVL
jgi:DNA replication and repair protein RecF